MIKIITSTIGAVLFIQMTKYMVANVVDMRTFVGVLTQFVAAGIIGSLVYVGLSWIIGSEEIKEVKEWMGK